MGSQKVNKVHWHRKLFTLSRQTRRICNRDARTGSAPVGGANPEAKEFAALDFVGVQDACSPAGYACQARFVSCSSCHLNPLRCATLDPVCAAGSFCNLFVLPSQPAALCNTRSCLRCRCLQTWWPSCPHFLAFSFSACRGEHPLRLLCVSTCACRGEHPCGCCVSVTNNKVLAFAVCL